MTDRRSTQMETRWVAPSEGAYLIELIFAAFTIDYQRGTDPSLLSAAGWEQLRTLRDALHDPLLGLDLKSTRCELAIEQPRGQADTVDAECVLETIRRAVARYTPKDEDITAPRWVTLCRRTDDPKLAWLERFFAANGIRTRRPGETSVHAPILEVRACDEPRALSLLNQPARKFGLRVRSTVSLDNVPDDHRDFRPGGDV